MDNEWNNNEYLPPQPEHSIDPEYTPEYPDVTFFKESAVTMREENIFQGEVPPGENPRDLREERRKKRSRYSWLRKFLGSAMRGGAAIVAAAALIGNAADTRQNAVGGARIKAMVRDLHEDAFEQPSDYSPEELSAVWRSDPEGPHQYDFDHLTVIKEATCTENGLSCFLCTDCGVQLIRVTTKDHEAGAPVQENIIEPDCVHDGSREDVSYCRVCGKELSRTKAVLGALGHTGGDLVIENVTDPNCTEDGSEDDVVYCAVCGEEISRTTVVLEALGHTEDEPVVENVTDPNCTEDGSEDEVVYCAVCGEEVSRTTVVLEALGHTEDEPVTENIIAANCTVKGSRDEVVYCSVCGEELSRMTESTPALGHTRGGPVTENIIAASCTVKGSRDEVVYCSVCGEEISRKTESTPALGHSYSASVTAPTCTERGYTTHSCSRCGDSYKDTYTAALGHSYTASVTAATCTAQGFTTHSCSRCGDSYKDTYTAALGHSYTASVTAATCTAQGYTTHTCSRCGDSYRDTYTAALGHSYANTVTAATCTAQGYTTHTCSRCSDSYRDTYTAALGHSFSIDGSTTWNNTTPQTCSRCGTYALTITTVNATTFSYNINTDFWNQARSMGLGYFEWGDCVVYDVTGAYVGYINRAYNEATSPSGTFVLDFVPESGMTYNYQLRLRVAASGSSDDVTFVYPQGGQMRTITAP